MAITRPTPKALDSTPEVDAFISRAPDAVHARKPKTRVNKQQISLTIAPALLAKVDEMATELGQSRASIISMAVYKLVEQGVTIDRLRK